MTIHEQLVGRECEACGAAISYSGRGRYPRFCDGACRQYAWALRHAEAALGTGTDTRPQVVRETTERTVTHEVAVPGPVEPVHPENARQWCELLEELTGQLSDPSHRMAREHWHHKRLFDALTRATAALGEAHPGGLDQVTGQR